MRTLAVSLKLFLVLSLLTGIVYPLMVTGLAGLLFPSKAEGSLVFYKGRIAGSRLIGQDFGDSLFFTSRPSAVSWNTLPSGASNLGPASLRLRQEIAERSSRFLTANSLAPGTEIPAEMVFASGSGLDPHISKRSALLQLDRVAEMQGLNAQEKAGLAKTIEHLTEKTGILNPGEERINVLLLNLELLKTAGERKSD